MTLLPPSLTSPSPGRLFRGNSTLREIVEECIEIFDVGFRLQDGQDETKRAAESNPPLPPAAPGAAAAVPIRCDAVYCPTPTPPTTHTPTAPHSDERDLSAAAAASPSAASAATCCYTRPSCPESEGVGVDEAAEASKSHAHDMTRDKAPHASKTKAEPAAQGREGGVGGSLSFAGRAGLCTAAAGWFPGVQTCEVRIQFVTANGQLSTKKQTATSYCVPVSWRPRLSFNGCSGFHYVSRPRTVV